MINSVNFGDSVTRTFAQKIAKHIFTIFFLSRRRERPADEPALGGEHQDEDAGDQEGQ